jgi:gliding motility-associated protein GldL
MSSNKGGFKEKFYHDIAPVVTGIGASIVILGALFKIQHYPGAGPMLVVGLGTEAALFIMFAFAPQPKEEMGLSDWAKVYPQLASEYDDYGDDEVANPDNTVKALSEMMSEANISQNTINALGSGLNSLAENASSMSDLSGAVAATNEYTENAKSASKQLAAVGDAYKTTADAMSGMANAASDAKEYHAQVQDITKNLGSLNAVYEMELQDANNHLKAMNKFYGNLSNAMENMSEASKDTEKFKDNLSALTSNLGQLNAVYGNMLTAMKG